MEMLGIILQVIQVLLAIVIIFLVLMQSDNEGGNIVTGGGQNSGMGMSKNTKIARLTTYVGIAFIVVTIISGALMLK